MKPLTIRIEKLEDNKTFKNLGANEILINNLGEKLYEGCIRALQWLVLILHYSN